MPFKSKAQKAWMYANKPEIAKRWGQEEKWDKINKNLPERLVPKGYWKNNK
jgi:hypothetical protein